MEIVVPTCASVSSLCKSDNNRWTFKINASRRFGNQFPYLGHLYHHCTTTTWNVRVEKSGQAEIRLQSHKKKLHAEEKECKLKKVKFFTTVILLTLLSMLSCNGCPSVRPSSCQNFEMVPLHFMTSWRDLVRNSRWVIATRNGFEVLRFRFPVMPSSFVCKCFYYMLSFVSLITYLFYI